MLGELDRRRTSNARRRSGDYDGRCVHTSSLDIGEPRTKFRCSHLCLVRTSSRHDRRTTMGSNLDGVFEVSTLAEAEGKSSREGIARAVTVDDRSLQSRSVERFPTSSLGAVVTAAGAQRGDNRSDLLRQVFGHDLPGILGTPTTASMGTFNRAGRLRAVTTSVAAPRAASEWNRRPP